MLCVICAHIAVVKRKRQLPWQVLIRQLFMVGKMCIRDSANINAQDEVGRTALMEACVAFKKEVIRLLVTRGAAVSYTHLDVYKRQV